MMGITSFEETESSKSSKEQHSSHSEDVNRRTIVLSTSEELRCHVVRSSTLSLKGLSIRSSVSFHHSKVSDLYLNIFVEETVLKLKIAMYHSLSMDKGDSA